MIATNGRKIAFTQSYSVQGRCAALMVNGFLDDPDDIQLKGNLTTGIKSAWVVFSPWFILVFHGTTRADRLFCLHFMEMVSPLYVELSFNPLSILPFQ